MANAKRDDNRITTLLGVSDVDSLTPVVVEADPTTKRLKVTATISGTSDVTISGTVPISAVSLPLPTGAATSANQTTIIGYVDGIEGLLTTIDADTGTLAGAITGTQMNVAVISMPTTTVDTELAEAVALTSDSVAIQLFPK